MLTKFKRLKYDNCYIERTLIATPGDSATYSNGYNGTATSNKIATFLTGGDIAQGLVGQIKTPLFAEIAAMVHINFWVKFSSKNGANRQHHGRPCMPR